MPRDQSRGPIKIASPLPSLSIFKAESRCGRERTAKLNNEDYAEGEYGPKTGIWRILRMLDEVKVKTTFLTCGGIAERYPDAMKAIAERGHEIAGHGYHHEIARDLTRQEEKD